MSQIRVFSSGRTSDDAPQQPDAYDALEQLRERQGVSAEKVADDTANEAAAYLDSAAPMGKYLADQLLLPMALAAGGMFATVKPSSHTLTNISVIQELLGPEAFVFDETADGVWLIHGKFGHWQKTVERRSGG